MVQTELCFTRIREAIEQTKPSKKTHKQRILDFIKSKGGICSNWAIDEWAVSSKDISASSASRRCRELAKEGLIYHPEIHGEINEHYWKIK